LGLGAFTACSVQNGGGEVVEADATSDVVVAEVGTTDGGVPDSSAIDVGPIEAAMVDAIADAGHQDAAPCSGVLCNGECLPNGDCHSCSGAPLLCGSTHACVSACAGCVDTRGAAMPIECFACDSNQRNPLGTCEYDDAGSYCLSGNYLGQYEGGAGYQCQCNDVSSCPGATQVCVPLGHYDAGFCLTCGEITLAQIQGQPCKDGGTCQAGSAVCQ